MRRLLAVCLVLTAASTLIASQTPPRTTVPLATLRHFDSPKPYDVAVGVQRTAFYMDAPSASLPAHPAVPGSAVSASSFSLRAWKEGDNARVVIYAVMDDSRAPKRRTETPIATFVLAVGQSAD